MHGDAPAAQPRTRLFQLIYAEEAASHPARPAGSLKALAVVSRVVTAGASR